MSGLVCILLLMVFGHSLANPISEWELLDDGIEPSGGENSVTAMPVKTDLKIYSDEMAEKPEPDNRPVAKLSANLDNFHARLTKAVLKANPNQNVIYSPISVSILLMMIMMGSRGSTMREIATEMGLENNQETLKGFHDLIKILQDVHGPKLNLANGVFITNNAGLRPGYSQRIKTYLDGEVKTTSDDDFELSANEINTWAKEHTDNHINNIVTAEDLNGISILIANAVFFRGGWWDTFDESKTQHNVPFHVSKDKTVPVTMMSVEAALSYGLIEEFKVNYIELPFKHDEGDLDTYSMFVFPPTKDSDTQSLEENLNRIDFRRLTIQTGNLILNLPKFSIKSTIKLQSILSNMGIRQIFSPLANLGGLSYNTDLFVDNILQKATLKVDEKGSEASAVSVASFLDRTYSPTITVNQPFLCAIVSKKLGIPVFVAKIVDPSESSE